jgi:hypothetical protein
MAKRRKLPRPKPPKKWTNSAAPISNIAFTGAPARFQRDGSECFAGPVTAAHADWRPNPYVRIIVDAERAQVNERTRGDRGYEPVIAGARTDKARGFLPYAPDAVVVDETAAERARAESEAYAAELDAYLDRLAELGLRPTPRGVELKCDAHVRTWAESADSRMFRVLHPCWQV